VDASGILVSLYAGVLIVAVVYAGKILVKHFHHFDRAVVAHRCNLVLPDPLPTPMSLMSLQSKPRNRRTFHLYFVRLTIAEILTLATIATVFVFVFVTASFLLGVFSMENATGITIVSIVSLVGFSTFAARSSALAFAKRHLDVDISDLL